MSVANHIIQEAVYVIIKKCIRVNNSIVVSENKVREPTDNSTILELISQNKELMNLLVIQTQEYKKKKLVLDSLLIFQKVDKNKCPNFTFQKILFQRFF